MFGYVKYSGECVGTGERCYVRYSGGRGCQEDGNVDEVQWWKRMLRGWKSRICEV